MELFLEAAIDSISLNAVSGLTQKHLDKRYQNDFNIDLAQAAYYKKKDFLEMIQISHIALDVDNLIFNTTQIK